MAGPWQAELAVRCESPEAAERMYRVLAPESSREVPRARAELGPPEDATLRLRIEARDTGALRAALQTFLGWVQLEEETARVPPP